MKIWDTRWKLSKKLHVIPRDKPVVPPGGLVFHGVCNNGRDAFTGLISSTQFINNV